MPYILYTFFSFFKHSVLYKKIAKKLKTNYIPLLIKSLYRKPNRYLRLIIFLKLI